MDGKKKNCILIATLIISIIQLLSCKTTKINAEFPDIPDVSSIQYDVDRNIVYMDLSTWIDISEYIIDTQTYKNIIDISN